MVPWLAEKVWSQSVISSCSRSSNFTWNKRGFPLIAAEHNISRHWCKEWTSSRTPGRPIHNVECLPDLTEHSILSFPEISQQHRCYWFVWLVVTITLLTGMWFIPLLRRSKTWNNTSNCLLQNKSEKLSRLVLEVKSLFYIYGLNT